MRAPHSTCSSSSVVAAPAAAHPYACVVLGRAPAAGRSGSHGVDLATSTRRGSECASSAAPARSHRRSRSRHAPPAAIPLLAAQAFQLTTTSSPCVHSSSGAPRPSQQGAGRCRRTLCASAAPTSAAAADLKLDDGERTEPGLTNGNGEAPVSSNSANGSSSSTNGKDAAAAQQPTGEDSSSTSSSNGGGSVPAGMAALAAAAAVVVAANVAASSTAANGNGGFSPAGSSPSPSGTGGNATPEVSEGSGSDSDSQRSSNNGNGAGSALAALEGQLKQLRAALEEAQGERLEAQARAQRAEVKSQEAHDAMAQAQVLYTDLNKQYSGLCEELEALKSSRGAAAAAAAGEASSRNGAGGAAAGGEAAAAGGGDLGRQVEDLQAQLEDMDYRLGWALRDLRAHQLVLRAQGELSLHLSGLPSTMQQQVFDQVDSGAELLGDGGSATVHAVTINGEQLAVKVMPLFDINTARPYHFRDICTTFLRHERSPYIEMPLHTFLRLKDDEVEGTQYFLYTIWPRRHMDVDQLLCTRTLQSEEIMTIMYHTVLALLDLAKARMVHADVKPPNVLVMVGADGLVSSAHLTDFGSVQFVPQGEEAAPAIWDGQLAWNWPPEQRDWVHLEACDAWGLALLYSCMKVHNPSKPEITDVLQDLSSANVLEFERVRDQQLLPDDPHDAPEMRSLTRLMRRCVVRDPRKRPGIRELVGAIQVLREQMQVQKRAAQARR